MANKRIPYQLQLFTLRLWPEIVNAEQWEWRGEVKDTRTGEAHYFRDWQVLVMLLTKLLAEPAEDESLDKSRLAVGSEETDLLNH